MLTQKEVQNEKSNRIVDGVDAPHDGVWNDQ